MSKQNSTHCRPGLVALRSLLIGCVGRIGAFKWPGVDEVLSEQEQQGLKGAEVEQWVYFRIHKVFYSNTLNYFKTLSTISNTCYYCTGGTQAFNVGVCYVRASELAGGLPISRERVQPGACTKDGTFHHLC